MSYSKMDYEQMSTNRFLLQLPKVVQWMEDLGCNAGVSRYTHYLKHIENVSLNHINDNMEERFRCGNLSFLEIVNIVMIYEQFRDEKSDGFVKRVKKVVSGKDFYEGDDQDQGRDALYELMIALWFRQKGYAIDFDQLTDVVAQSNEAIFLIECKRLKTAKKFEDNFRKGCKQLKQRVNANSFKLVFVDIYNCIKEKIPVYEYDSIVTMQQKIKQEMQQHFITLNQSHIDKILSEYKTDVDGIAFTALFVLWLFNNTPQHFWEVTVQANANMEDERYKQFVMCLQV